MVKFTRQARQVLIGSGIICSAVGAYVLWKDFTKGREQSTTLPKKLEGKVYLVTGANSGIGRAITQDLARRKAKVYMLCRDMDLCEESRKEIVLKTRNKYVYCRPCDLGSQQSIRNFVDDFKKTQNRVDGLVNNAGIMRAPRAYSPEGIEIHLATNHVGHFLLTNLLLDVLKASAPSRILYLMNPDYKKANLDLSDLNLDKNYNKSVAFTNSQLANMLIVQEFADRLKDDNVTCNAVYPGVVSGTGIKRYMGVDKSFTGRVISQPLLKGITRSPEKGAQTVLYLLLEEALQNVTGKLYSNMEEKAIENVATNSDLGKKLFLVDEYWTGLKTKEEILKVKGAS